MSLRERCVLISSEGVVIVVGNGAEDALGLAGAARGHYDCGVVGVVYSQLIEQYASKNIAAGGGKNWNQG